jgi:hypothetical protein
MLVGMRHTAVLVLGLMLVALVVACGGTPGKRRIGRSIGTFIHNQLVTKSGPSKTIHSKLSGGMMFVHGLTNIR